ncbi:hypothetical protein [Neptunomonas phycophila]|uniref:hypothetical protein n=1 Tax=Neptunomonas phycophila TaxID=1572645 RepID=UPI003734E07E
MKRKNPNITTTRKQARDDQLLVAKIWQYNNKLTSTQMAKKFGCKLSDIRRLRTEHGIESGVYTKNKPAPEPTESLIEGVSQKLLRIDFLDFGKQLKNGIPKKEEERAA